MNLLQMLQDPCEFQSITFSQMLPLLLTIKSEFRPIRLLITGVLLPVCAHLIYCWDIDFQIFLKWEKFKINSVSKSLVTARWQHSNTGLITFQQLLTLKKKRKIRLDLLGYGYSSGLLPAATKLGQGNVFTGVCLSTGGGEGVCLSACWDARPPQTRHTPQSRPPPEQTPPRTRHTPPEQTPPWDQAHPPPGADSSIRSTSGRYASYWNALLFAIYFMFIGGDLRNDKNPRRYTWFVTRRLQVKTNLDQKFQQNYLHFFSCDVLIIMNTLQTQQTLRFRVF